jgi:radical SAM superfamily enzyme YgiQ (UPF0313 family)
MKYKKIVIVNYRSNDVIYLPNYELFIAEAMKSHGVAEDIKTFTLFNHENLEKYFPQWKDADLILCWESFSTKAPTYVSSYFRLAKAVKQKLKAPILFGGFWATSYGRYFNEFKVFDKIIEGFSIDKLVDALSNYQNGTDRFINIYGDSNYDKYPLNMEYLATPKKYIVNGSLFGYMSTFSCPRNCKFCFSNAARYFKSNFSARDIETIKKDIDVLDNYYNFKGFVLKDLNVFYNKKRAFKYLGYLKEKGKYIDVNLDVTINDLDEELISELNKLGIVEFLYFGLESFNPEIRKKIGKPFTDRELEKAFDLADKHEINLTGNVILGLPWQTIEDVHYDIKKALYYINKYKHVFIMINIYKPEYGTDIQREYFKDLHQKISFEELIDIYLNNVSKYQNRIYGDKFGSLDIEKLFNLMRLINKNKYVLNTGLPMIRRKCLQYLGNLLIKQLESPPYITNPFVRIVLKRNCVTFIDNFIYPFFSIKRSKFTPGKIRYYFKNLFLFTRNVLKI